MGVMGVTGVTGAVPLVGELWEARSTAGTTTTAQASAEASVRRPSDQYHDRNPTPDQSPTPDRSPIPCHTPSPEEIILKCTPFHIRCVSHIRSESPSRCPSGFPSRSTYRYLNPIPSTSHNTSIQAATTEDATISAPRTSDAPNAMASARATNTTDTAVVT